MKHLLIRRTPEERRRREVLSVWDDVARWLDASPEQHDADLAAVVAAAQTVIDETGRRGLMRTWRDERSADATRLWLRLVAR